MSLHQTSIRLKVNLRTLSNSKLCMKYFLFIYFKKNFNLKIDQIDNFAYPLFHRLWNSLWKSRRLEEIQALKKSCLKAWLKLRKFWSTWVIKMNVMSSRDDIILKIRIGVRVWFQQSRGRIFRHVKGTVCGFDDHQRAFHVHHELLTLITKKLRRSSIFVWKKSTCSKTRLKGDGILNLKSALYRYLSSLSDTLSKTK